MKIGIYGGSFNPPHLGHMAAAESAAKYLGLDELLLIPAGIPPHKALSADAAGKEHRLAMTRLMGEQIALDTGITVTVSDMEVARVGKSYSVDTVREIHEQRPNDELWLLMGTDMFLSFQNWYKPEEILRHAGLCAFGRTEKDGETLFAPQRDFLGGRCACYLPTSSSSLPFPSLGSFLPLSFRDSFVMAWKKNGMKSVAMQVEKSIPPTTAVPMA